MKKQILILVFIAFSIFSFSQYGNEWINFTQKYYKFPISKQGVFKISRDYLVSIDNSFASINPKNLQIFARGKEIPIYVFGENDFSFDSGDYIQFFAKPNDAWLDTAIFDNPDDLTNPHYSYFNDTIYYFLTWEISGTTKKRFISESDTAFTNYNKLDYCNKLISTQYVNEYYWAATNPKYTKGEGWFDNYVIDIGSAQNKTISLNNYTTNENVKVKTAIAGVPATLVSSNIQHWLKIDYNGNNYVDVQYTGYNTVKPEFIIPSSLITSSNLALTFSSNSISGQPDRNAISYIDIEYSHNMNFENTTDFEFYLPSTSNQKNGIEISNFNHENNLPIILDLTNNIILPSYIIDSKIRFVAPFGTIKRNFNIFSQNSITSINNIEKVNFTNYSTTYKNTKFVIITNKLIKDAAIQYKTYRNLQLQTELFYVDELYEQFSYGINNHPIAIKNFLNYISTKYDEIPTGVLFLGKSLHARLYRKSIENINICLVPSFGNPSSDNLFTSGIGGRTIEPLIPTGRVAAKNNTDVTTYLNKLQQYESTGTQEWQKNIIHFGGGYTSLEQSTFSSYLENYENIIEDTLFGGNVSTFLKTSSEPIQITQSDSISNLINNGVSLMTFFGHGSSTGFDQNIDEPSAYNNYGKYGFMLANSCLAGDIHISPTGFTNAEDWVFTQNKGVIGFIADVDLGIAYYLNLFSNELYKNFSYKNYGGYIGQSIKNTIKEINLESPNNQYVINTSLEFTLHGDPLVKFSSAEKPDLVIENLTFTPTIISTEIDSFLVNITIKNIGQATANTFVLELNRTFSDGTEELKVKNIYGLYYKDTVSIKLAVDNIKGVGINTFCAKIDALNQINELSELNNTTCTNFNILSGDLTPIWPYKYAIYPNDTVTLKASIGNPFAQDQINVFEIDTTDTYNSPFKQTIEILHQGGVVKWFLPFNLTENRVYYWRVSKKNSNSWKENSFIYIDGKTGWSQAHYFQFKNNEYKFIDYNRTQKRFDYVTEPKNFKIWNKGTPTEAETYDIRYRLDEIGDYGVCGGASAIVVIVIDSLTLEPWLSDKANYGQRDYPICYSRNQPSKFLTFNIDSTSLENCAQLIHLVPNGNYIALYNIWSGNFQNWTQNLKNEIGNLYPATNVGFVPNNYPYIFFSQKGNPSISAEIIGTSATSEITYETNLVTNFNYGNITSEIAGPAFNWDSFIWKWKTDELISYDSTNISLSGIKLDGTENVLINNLINNDSTITNLENYVNATEYPYIKLNMYSKDDSLKTPSQIIKWQLTSQQVPETAINPEKGYYFYKDTLQEGDDIIFSVATENVSKYNMDSLLVKYFVKDRNNITHQITEKKLRPHPTHDVIIDTVKFNTLGFPGLNTIWVEFNPINTSTNYYDQLEQYHFNNIAQKYFFVNRDNMNPLLDVTFDGIHILDGDLVSAKPEILISLKDENKYLELNDPNLFKVYIKKPNSIDDEIVTETDSLGNTQLYWTPAQLPKNSCKLLYTPSKLNDGIYQLRVSATDISSNESGKYDYLVNFEVENKSTITNVFNYPNPFSTSTRFVFTLTGSQIPDEFTIEIMTISGKLVKIIDLAEESTIRIGKNITDYFWDGTDMYGDKLANGVYFYRVKTKINGQNLEKRETETNQYFKKDWGKLYIMR